MVQDVSSKSETLLIIASLSSATCVKQRGMFFEDIKLHDENNEVSTKSETIGDINNASTCLVCEYVKVMFDPKNTFSLDHEVVDKCLFWLPCMHLCVLGYAVL